MRRLWIWALCLTVLFVKGQFAEEEDFVDESFTYSDVVGKCDTVEDPCQTKHFPKDVLAYLTPWNSRGFHLALKCKRKFTYLAPVWYTIRLKFESRLSSGLF